MSREIVKKLYLKSCFEELKILKPGNHSIYSKIIGMNLEKFRRAAKISSDILTDKNLSIGNAIFFSSRKCFIELGSNYNLGIVLLCAPIIKISIEGIKNLRSDLKKEVASIKNEDGDLIFKAIDYVKPGGIGKYKGKGNVSSYKKSLNFRKAMKIGSKWDRISRCYEENYSEILNFGLPYYRSIKLKKSEKVAAELLYLNYLSTDTDSHIQRKFGREKALSVMRKSQMIQKQINLKKNYKRILLKLDKYLKVYHYNPGTCADLTVTTLLIDKIIDIFRCPV